MKNQNKIQIFNNLKSYLNHYNKVVGHFYIKIKNKTIKNLILVKREIYNKKKMNLMK